MIEYDKVIDHATRVRATTNNYIINELYKVFNEKIEKSIDGYARHFGTKLGKMLTESQYNATVYGNNRMFDRALLKDSLTALNKICNELDPQLEKHNLMTKLEVKHNYTWFTKRVKSSYATLDIVQRT